MCCPHEYEPEIYCMVFGNLITGGNENVFLKRKKKKTLGRYMF